MQYNIYKELDKDLQDYMQMMEIIAITIGI